MLLTVWKTAVLISTLYLVTLAGVAVIQRALQYFPEVAIVTPAQAGLKDVETLRLVTPDGERLEAWFAPPREGKPLILYFHGNGGLLAARAERFGKMLASGYGLLAIAYRGYGGSTGAPTEAGLLLDGETAYAEATRRGFGPERLVIVGESLGTGVATILASRHAAAALVLDAPFSSALHVAQTHYWFLPVRWLMRDQFRSDLAIGAVRIPVLMTQGEDDEVVPIDEGRSLFALANEPKRFIAVANAQHLVLGLPQVYPEVEAFINAQTTPRADDAKRR
ncbi:MAG TPA: alpha/beta hydrolase [Methylocystis sp.]|nr:alpha/beta hydrolase [Methylocystis sp.]